jgi:hypothetical protein
MNDNEEISATPVQDRPTGSDDRLDARTGADQPWDPEDLAAAQGKDPTPVNVERAQRELEDIRPAAIEKTVP